MKRYKYGNDDKVVRRIKMAKVVFINAEKGAAEVRDIPDDYREIDKALGCEIFSIVGRKIGKSQKVWDIYHDDNFLFQPRTGIPTGKCTNYDEILFENIFVARHTPSGRMKGLTDEEIKEILDNVHSGVLFYHL